MVDSKFTPIEIYDPNYTGQFGARERTKIPGDHEGFIQPLSGSEHFKDGKNGEKAEFLMFTYIETPVKYGYEVEQDEEKYKMLYTNTPKGVSGLGHHKEIVLGEFK